VPETAGQREEIRARFLGALSKARPKELAHDYLDREAVTSGTERAQVRMPSAPEPPLTLDDIRHQGREAWLAARAERQAQERAAELQPEGNRDRTPERAPPPMTLEEQRAAGREAWRRLREQGPPAPEADSQEQERDRGLERKGPELEL